MAHRHQCDAQQLARHFTPVARGSADTKHLPVHPHMRHEVELPEHMRALERFERALGVTGGPVPGGLGHGRLEGLDPP